jgi:hypothetical protein
MIAGASNQFGFALFEQWTNEDSCAAMIVQLPLGESTVAIWQSFFESGARDAQCS